MSKIVVVDYWESLEEVINIINANDLADNVIQFIEVDVGDSILHNFRTKVILRVKS